jgi:plasmid stabilization system protein ParE
VKTARFDAEARREFLAQIAYYAEHEPGLGERFSLAVEAAVRRILEVPAAGSPARRNTRRAILTEFPFSIYSRLEGETVYVFAVAHHARRPGSWESRAALDRVEPES